MAMPRKAHHFAPDMFLFLAYGRTERGSRYIAFPSFLSPCHPPPLPFSLTGLFNPLPSCPSKVKSCPTLAVLVKLYRALPPKFPPVPSTIASGVRCRERKDSGSAGGGVHVLLSFLPVSLRWPSGTDICAITLLTFSQCRAQSSGLFHSSCLGIPLHRMGAWAHLWTYVIALLPSLYSFT